MNSQSSFFTSSPTVVLPPQQPNQYFASGPFNNPVPPTSQPINNQTMPPFTEPMATTEPIAPMPSSLAGRKRSRGDVNAPEEEAVDIEDGSVTTPLSEVPTKPRGKPIYGPGMSLVYPEDPGYSALAESQSGTWVEERAELNQFQRQFAHAKRPSVSSRKSQRKDTSASDNDNLAQLVLPPQMREATTEPLIDEATRVLGISWTRLDGSEAGQINQAAYSKWIQNHYPSLKEVTVWFEEKSIPGYLVAARNACTGEQVFYIFSHDLTEARLVTTDPAQLVPRLKMLPNGLEIAAPGGCIRAEMDPASAAQNEVDRVEVAMATGGAEAGEATSAAPNGVCTAHEMEMD